MSARLALYLCLLSSLCSAAILRITVKDPSGAVISGAAVSIQQAGTPARQLVTAGTGIATIDLPAGKYHIAVNAPRFDSAEQDFDLTQDAELAISLKLATVETTLDIVDRLSSLANSDPYYRALRDSPPTLAFAVKDLVLQRDAATITLKSGWVALQAPVLRRSAIAVFSGEGTFHLDPAIPHERDHVRAVLKSDTIDETFDSALLVFTDATILEINRGNASIDVPTQAADLLKRFRSRLRHRSENPRSMTEAILFGAEIPNIEADLLAELYDPHQQGSFSAFIHGRKHSDLRFLLKPNGALPGLPSPEEVAVIGVDGGESDGIWYLTHTRDEWKKGSASNAEVKRIVDADHYRIETAIARNGRLTAVADIRLHARNNGPRVVPFGLLPTLRVTRVSIDGKEIPYLQESRRADGAFHVILPQPLVQNQPVTLRVEYQGNKVLENLGGGNYAVGARESWYPSLNAFQQQAPYELVFKVPKGMTLVSVGKLVRESQEGDFAVTEWKTDTPVAVAGFNYGQYQRKSVEDDATRTLVETYATREAPDAIRRLNLPMVLTPSAMASQAMVETQNAMRVFTTWFGPAPYGRIAITQQPQFNFGQSWPTLVYLPVSAFLDSTQRWALLGGNAFRFSEFIQEVTPHEVAHQWWGHMVGWASYHDQWLSEGFSDFSAAIYLLNTEKKPDKFVEFWKRAQKTILEKNEYGVSANDAGPIWMGFRLNTFQNGSAYNRLVYPKGGYVLYMLRNLMYDSKTGDKDFIEMMHDFVKSSMYQPASLESFMACVDRHMKPSLDLGGNGSSAWFFIQWVLGKDVPKYKLEYSLAEQQGKTMLTARLTQSGVSEDFRMRVPLYAEVDGRQVRLGSIAVVGNSTTQDVKVQLPRKPKRVIINAYQDVLAAESVCREI